VTSFALKACQKEELEKIEQVLQMVQQIPNFRLKTDDNQLFITLKSLGHVLLLSVAIPMFCQSKRQAFSKKIFSLNGEKQ
jgi:hypothetical protein